MGRLMFPKGSMTRWVMTGDVRFTQLPVFGFSFKVGKNSKDDFKTQYAQVINGATPA